MFALDHIHYSRWLTIHLKDLNDLPVVCPSEYNAFSNGKFVTQKSTHRFSAIPHDQSHEQQNAVVKGEGGVIGITENEDALRRWMIAGPEIALILSEHSFKIDNGVNHHEQTQSSQDCFVKDVKNLVNAFEDAGNPYMEESDELLTLNTKVIMSSEVVSNIRRAESLGISQFEKFYSARIVSN